MSGISLLARLKVRRHPAQVHRPRVTRGRIWPRLRTVWDGEGLRQSFARLLNELRVRSL